MNKRIEAIKQAPPRTDRQTDRHAHIQRERRMQRDLLKCVYHIRRALIYMSWVSKPQRKHPEDSLRTFEWQGPLASMQDAILLRCPVSCCAVIWKEKSRTFKNIRFASTVVRILRNAVHSALSTQHLQQSCSMWLDFIILFKCDSVLRQAKLENCIPSWYWKKKK